jgi:hypothetical protein
MTPGSVLANLSFQQVCHQSVVSLRSVIGGYLDFHSDATEIIDASQQVRRPGPVTQHNTLRNGGSPRGGSISALPQTFLSQRHKRRLPNSASHHDQLVGGWRLKAIP